MSAHVETLYGASSPSLMALGPYERPTSMTSGAAGPLLPLLAVIASSSCCELPSGFRLLIGMPYLAVNPSRSAPYPHHERGSAIVVRPPSALAAAMSDVRSVPLDAMADGAAAEGAAADGAVVAADEQAARARAAMAPNAANRDSDRSVRNLLLQRFRGTSPRPLGRADRRSPRPAGAARRTQGGRLRISFDRTGLWPSITERLAVRQPMLTSPTRSRGPPRWAQPRFPAVAGTNEAGPIGPVRGR